MSTEAYERGFIDGMQKQMQSSVDKAVNAMSRQAEKQEPVANYCRECLTYNGHQDGCSHATPQPQREWVGLTDDEIDQGLLRSDYALQTAHAWRAGVVFAMTQLKEKNT